ncbi:TPA: HNH endonuclease [Klebsiella variicola subsp. variicola]
MADINNVYSYSEDDLASINAIKQGNYTHLSWGDDSLADVRRNIRDFYRNEQRGTCAFCKNEISLRSALNCTIEHIIPKSLNFNFMFTANNLCVICADCNEIKRAQEVINEIPDVTSNSTRRVRYPTTGTVFKIVHPHFDSWNEHIIRFGRAYIDKSTKGANTIVICKLNRFFHEFEVGDEYITEIDLRGLMEEYISTQSILRRAELLFQIKAELR